MGTSIQEISEWFDEGVRQGATLLVVCDTYDYEDYPEYAKSKEQALAMDKNPGSMQRVMEVYVLDPKRKNIQLRTYRCKNFD